MNTIATILVNYNGINDTIATIESLKQSTVKTDVIVVDNASKNDEGKKLETICPEITVITNTHNVGFAAANNIGINRAVSMNYDYVLVLNNDVEVEPSMIEELLKYGEKGYVAAPLMFYFSKRNTVWFGGGRINKHTGASEHIDMNKPASGNLTPMECSFLTGCCMMIPVSIIDSVGLFDESFFMYCEDSDYSVRLMERGIPMVLNPNAILWHKVGMSTGGGYNMFNTYYNTRNRLLCIKKHKGYFSWTALFITYITRMIRIVQYMLTGKKYWKAVWWGVSDGFRNVNGETKRDLRM